MADPLRRRLRARGLAALTSVAGVVPGALVRGGLRGAGLALRRGRYARTIRDNLRLAYGAALDGAERERLVRSVFHHAARQLEEWMALARGENLAAEVEIDASVERVEACLAQGRGALVVTAHLGNWELLAAALSRRGFAGAVVGRHRERDPSARWWIEMRQAYGVHTLPQDSSPRRLLEVLRGGGVLGLLTDLEVRRLDGLHIPFFGRPALTMTAPAALARAARLPLLPVRCVVPPGGTRYVLSVEEPLQLEARSDREQARRALLERQNALFESWIRATPEQWAWHQPRWRTAPGEVRAVPLAERKRQRARRTPDA